MNLGNKFLGETLPEQGLTIGSAIEPQISESFENRLDFGDLVERSLYNDGIATMIMEDRGVDASAFNPDKNWNKDEARLKYQDDIHPDFLDSMMERAVSEKHADALFETYYDKSIKQRYLEEQAWYTQLGLGAIGEIPNLPIYAGAVAMAPYTAVALTLTAGTRFLGAGGGGLVLEGIKDILGTQDKTAVDYVGAVLIDGTLGAVLGKKIDPINDIARDNLYKIAGIDAKVEARINDAKTKEERDAIIKKAYEDKNKKVPDSSFMSAFDEAIKYSKQSSVQKLWEAGRQDLSYVTRKSESDTLADFGSQLFHDQHLQALNKDTPDRATSVHRLEGQMIGAIRNELGELEREFSELMHGTKGFFGLKVSGAVEDEFSNLIGAIQKKKSIAKSIGTKMTDDLAIKKVLDEANIKQDARLVNLLKKSTVAMSNIAKRHHEYLGDAGNIPFKRDATGKSNIPEDPDYMHFVYDKGYVTSLRNEGLTPKQLSRFFSNAIKSQLLKNGVTDINEKELVDIGRIFYENVTNSNIDTGKTFSNMLDEIMATSKDLETREAIKKIQSKRVVTDEQAGVGARTRTNIDYGYAEEFMIGGKKRTVTMERMISNDYMSSMNMYSRKMAGTTHLQQTKWKEAPQRFSNERSLELAREDKDVIELEKIKRQREESILELHKERQRFDAIIENMNKKLFDGKMTEQRILKTLNDIVEKQDGLERIIKKAEDMKVDIEFEANNLLNIVDKIAELETISSKNIHIDKIIEKKMIDVANSIKAESMKPKERTLATTQDIIDFKEQIRRELDKKVAKGIISQKKAQKELVRINTILKDLQGMSTAKDPTGLPNRLYRVAHSFNIGRLLGQTAFTMPAEAMTVAYDVGIRNFIESFSSFKSVLKSYKDGKIDNKQLAELQEFTGIFNEFQSSPKLYELEHDFDANIREGSGKILPKVENFGQGFAEFTLMMGGIKPLTAFFQTAHALGVMKKIKAVADGGSPDAKYGKMINELGFNEKTLTDIYKNMTAFADKDAMNFKNWDVETRNIFLDGLQRRTDTLVQAQRLGDKPAWVSEKDYMFKDTFIGKIAMELKTFVFTAYAKQLGYGVMRKDAHIAGIISAQIAALTVAYLAKTGLNYAGNQEAMDRALQPEVMAGAIIGMLPMATFFPQVIDVASTATIGQPIFGQSRNSGGLTDTISSLPSIDLANNLIKIFGIPAKAIKDEEITSDTFAPLLKATGVSNAWLTRPLVEATKKQE